MGAICAVLGLLCAATPAPSQAFERPAITFSFPTAAMSNWVQYNKNAPSSEWSANLCDAEGNPSPVLVPIGRATLPGPMRGQFIYDPATTQEQRDYIDHWTALARHCEETTDDTCSEVWSPPCRPCDDKECPVIM